MTKKELRKKFLALRNTQPISQKKKRDISIFTKLKRFLPFSRAKIFFTYISHGSEVSTNRIMEYFINKKNIIVPKVSGKSICLYRLRDAKNFKKGTFGIREPSVCIPHKELREIDVALIPGIAFDITGHRIGFGGGYFDRLLKKLRCTTIGLAYEFQIIDKVPKRKYDVAVKYIVTEKRVIKCT